MVLKSCGRWKDSQHKPFGRGELERSAWEVHPTFKDAVWAYHPNLAGFRGRGSGQPEEGLYDLVVADYGEGGGFD